MTVYNNENVRVAELTRVERLSPTLGRKPPEGAIVLFDGTSADEFDGGKMSDDKLLMQGCTSRKKLGSGELHVEFMLPWMPNARGQGRGNSGVYLQGRYEVQVLDSFGLTGEQNACGGIYSISKPLLNMCLPPLTWQTYDIDFTPAQFDAAGKKVKNAVTTVRHNGVVIHDHVEIKGSTGGGKPEDSTGGQIQLQGHGNPVFYRNIWVLPR